MRVGIIVFNNLRYTPFIKYYTDTLDQIIGVEYEIVYYNRDRSLNEPKNDKYHPIPWIGRGTNAAPKVEKAINFAFWRVYCKSLLKKKNFDFLIIIMTSAAVLLKQYLINNYSGRFIFDVRDYTQEHIKAFLDAEKELVEHSSLNVISSPGFLHFLPSSSYEVCHNLTSDVDTIKVTKYTKNAQLPIRISYIGSISYEDQCISLIRLVAKDNRFSFCFYGNENTSHRVSKEVELINCERITMAGPFEPTEKERLYKSSDLVFNCYGNDTPLVKYAISNKHYDGALYKVPVIMSPGTIMDELSKGNGFPLDLDRVTNLDGLYDWYVNLDAELYDAYATKVIEDSKRDNYKLREHIKSIIQALHYSL